MNPFFFGDTDRALYGVHHPPRGTTARAAGVVLCYPFAQEYMRAHRAFRQLSLMLSAEGFHVLRFDYTGTGDSAGDPTDMRLARWDEDLAQAIDELVDTASVESVWIVGLRLGAALALRAATRRDVSGVVLWDPIVAGTEILAEGTSGRGNAAGLEVGGIPISSSFRTDLGNLNLMYSPVLPGARVLLAVSADEPQFVAFREKLERDGASVSYACMPSDGRWSFFDNWGSALIPQELIRAIVNHLKEAIR